MRELWIGFAAGMGVQTIILTLAVGLRPGWFCEREGGSDDR